MLLLLLSPVAEDEHADSGGGGGMNCAIFLCLLLLLLLLLQVDVALAPSLLGGDAIRAIWTGHLGTHARSVCFDRQQTIQPFFFLLKALLRELRMHSR